MIDKAYNKNGCIVDITTVKIPEYSQELRDLIQDCLHPTPRNRIRLDILRISINEFRNRIKDGYEQSSDNEKSRFESESLLFYNKDEINNMPPGNWEPYDKKKRPEGELFPETASIRYPVFPDDDGDDGGEDDGGEDDGGEDDGDEDEDDEDDDDDDDGDDDEAGAPVIMQQKGISPQSPDLL